MVRAPQANAIAEQFVGTVRRECLDRMLTLSRRHLDATLRVFANHYNGAGLIERLAWKLRRGNAFTRWARVDPRSSAATYSAVSSTSMTSQRDRILGTHRLRSRALAPVMLASMWKPSGVLVICPCTSWRTSDSITAGLSELTSATSWKRCSAIASIVPHGRAARRAMWLREWS